jgi:L-rhamnonate dehydratase
MQRSAFVEFNVTTGPLSREICLNPIRMKDGYVAVPQEPGLGVEVDEAALERYRVKP